MLKDYYRLKHVRGLLSVKTYRIIIGKNICKMIIYRLKYMLKEYYR